MNYISLQYVYNKLDTSVFNRAEKNLVIYLFVEQHIDDGVKNSRCLWEKGRDSHELGSEGSSLVHEDPESNTSIRSPSRQETKNHQNDHSSHLLLCLLSGCWFLLGRGSLKQVVCGLLTNKSCDILHITFLKLMMVQKWFFEDMPQKIHNWFLF